MRSRDVLAVHGDPEWRSWRPEGVDRLDAELKADHLLGPGGGEDLVHAAPPAPLPAASGRSPCTWVSTSGVAVPLVVESTTIRAR